MFKKIINLGLCILLIASTVSLSGCSFRKHKNGYDYKEITLDSAQEANAKIKTDLINDTDIDMEITIPAQFKARNQSVDTIYAPLDGKIVDVFVDPGTVVKKGQAIAKIKSDEISQIELEYLDRMLDIDENIGEMRAQYNLSQQSYKRERTLFSEKISSRADYETAFAQLRKDKAAYDSQFIKKSALTQVYQQRLAVYGSAPSIAAVARSRHASPYLTLTAAKSGIILERKVNPGEFVEKDTELFNLADLSKIWLVGYAFEKDSPFLKEGQKIRGSLEESSGMEINGILSYVSPILDPNSKTLEVRAEVDNKDLKIKPNMYAQMFVNIGKVKRLAVPNSALEKYGDYTFAYVKTKPHTYEERKVVIGKKNDKYAEVVSGLKLGEEVVTNGSFALLGESIKKQESNE